MPFQKMYAILVGRVDDTIEYLSGALARNQCDWTTIDKTIHTLKAALLEAEGIYLEWEED